MKYTIVLSLTTLVLWAFVLSSCGRTVKLIKHVPGPQGEVGAQGPAGLNGESCSVETLINGSLISCPDGSSSFISNGVNGQDGADGQDGQNGVDGEDAPPAAFNIVEIIDPCGPSGGFDEVLLVLADGSILAYFAGAGGFLTVLQCGKIYVTTDAQSCVFKLDIDCNYIE